jgi:hypothetical protein
VSPKGRRGRTARPQQRPDTRIRSRDRIPRTRAACLDHARSRHSPHEDPVDRAPDRAGAKPRLRARMNGPTHPPRRGRTIAGDGPDIRKRTTGPPNAGRSTSGPIANRRALAENTITTATAAFCSAVGDRACPARLLQIRRARARPRWSRALAAQQSRNDGKARRPDDRFDVRATVAVGECLPGSGLQFARSRSVGRAPVGYRVGTGPAPPIGLGAPLLRQAMQNSSHSVGDPAQAPGR